MIETIIGIALLNILFILGIGFCAGIWGVTFVRKSGLIPDFDDYLFGAMFPFVIFAILSFLLSIVIWSAYWAHYFLW